MTLIAIMKVTKSIGFTVAIGAAVSVSLLLLWNQNRVLRRELETLRGTTTDEIVRLRQENAAMAAARVDTNELARLRAGQSELLRLRGQVGQLRGQLQQAALLRPQAHATNRSSSAELAPMSEANELGPFTANLTARIGGGQTLVTGGWTTSPGNRTLALLTPSVVDLEGNSVNSIGGDVQVMLRSFLIEAPEELWVRAGLGGVKSDLRNSTQQGLLTTDQTRSLLDAFKDATGVHVLSAPTVTTLSGRQAQITIGQKAFGNGVLTAPVHRIDVVPQITADNSAIALTLGVHLSPWDDAATETRPKQGNP